ncbi:AAA family ATPase [Panacagrimonas sp.]|uniref:AAA family ATPase n=1 Tax=Panacagrimonas sp. TaxID=2480088 RepID=UPI003B52AEE1
MRKSSLATSNPLITHLGDFPRGDALTKILFRRAEYGINERTHSKEDRIGYLSRLSSTFYPRPEYLRYSMLFDRLVRAGYEPRRNLIEGNGPSLCERSPGIVYNTAKTLPIDGSCLLLAGATGSGKTYITKLICAQYPEYIDHGQITKGRIQLVQIPVLYVRCPSNGSLISLGRAFFLALDERLQLHGFYSKRAEKTSASTEDLSQAMSQACKTHAIGALVFDEFQDLMDASHKSSRGIINFLLSLRDTIKVPIVYVGTFPMLSLFGNDGRSARRSAAGGAVLIARFPSHDDEIWMAMCDAYWAAQWTKKPSKLTPQLRKLIYSLSQGIPDYFHQVFVRAQELAIESGHERLDEDTLQDAFDYRCQALHTTVAALAKGTRSEIHAFRDLSHPWVEPVPRRARGTK